MKAGSHQVTHEDQQSQPDNVYSMPRQKKNWDTMKIAYAVAAFAFTLFLGAAIDECSGRNDFTNLELMLRDQARGFSHKAAISKTKSDFQYWTDAAHGKQTEADRVIEMSQLCTNKNFKKLSCPNLWNGQQAQNQNVAEGQR